MQPSVGTIPHFTIYDRLRKAREVSGLDQTELAERIGVSRTSVSSYEAGRIARPRKIVLNAWGLATGVPVQWLETGEEPTPGPGDDGAPAGGAGAGGGLPRLDSNQQPSD
ncbi:helix-turn-helix domain-containing protein [Actinomyces lilanjuaniae]